MHSRDIGAALSAALEEAPKRVNEEELYEICGQGSERELCDLLRHAMNRQVRPALLTQREKSVPGMVSRVDLMVWNGQDRIRPAAVVEAKMIYASDVIDVRDRWHRYLLADAKKLQPVVTADVPAYLITWVPAFLRVTRDIRYMRGHVDGLPRFDLARTRPAVAELLTGFGTPRLASTIQTKSNDGELVLDAYITSVDLRRSG